MAAKFTKAYCHLEESEEEIMAEWMQMAGDAYAVRVPIKPGVREYLDRCRTAGERMIVLTSSVPEHCRAALGRLGLTEYFERILFAHDLGMDKKDPETFRHAAALMGVMPEDCTMYDDSVAACRAAREAGMQVVGVYDAFSTSPGRRCSRCVTGSSAALRNCCKAERQRAASRASAVRSRTSDSSRCSVQRLSMAWKPVQAPSRLPVMAPVESLSPL